MKEQLTPEQICLSFLKAVEKAKLYAQIKVGAKRKYSDLPYPYSWTAPLITNGVNPVIQISLWKDNGTRLIKVGGDELRTDEKLSQEETATHLLSMIKELEVYGIKLEEV